MSQIEKMYYDWSEEQIDSKELSAKYRKVSDVLTELIGIKKFNEIDAMIMDCVIAERYAAFKGGFQQATAIWKECC